MMKWHMTCEDPERRIAKLSMVYLERITKKRSRERSFMCVLEKKLELCKVKEAAVVVAST